MYTEAICVWLQLLKTIYTLKKNEANNAEEENLETNPSRETLVISMF